MCGISGPLMASLRKVLIVLSKASMGLLRWGTILEFSILLHATFPLLCSHPHFPNQKADGEGVVIGVADGQRWKSHISLLPEAAASLDSMDGLIL